MTTKISYPQVIGELIQLLDCPQDLAGCYQVMKMIRSQEAVQILIKDGLYAGCYDDEEIDRRVCIPILQQYPQLEPLVTRFKDEGGGFSMLAAWLNDFVESVAWLSGNRPLPTDRFSFVKNAKDCGIITFGDGCYRIRSRDTNEIWSYHTAFAVAMDGWRID